MNKPGPPVASTAGAPRPTGFELVPITRCPICHDRRRVPSDGMAVERGQRMQGRFYLEPVANVLQLTVEELAGKLQTYRCERCGNFYNDPWLSPELAATLFGVFGPDHLFAWATFESWLHRRPRFRTNERLFDVVSRRIGPLTSYAELACPFQGFLTYFREVEATPRQRIGLFARALRRPTDPRWTTIPRLYHFAERAVGRCVVMGLRAKAVASFARDKLAGVATGSPRTPASPLPKHRYLLTKNSTLGWGSNCVRYGGSCRYFSHLVLDAPPLPFDEVYRQRSHRFELIGIFNSLDHIGEPMGVIRRALDIADHVLLVTHQARRAGNQHLYAFSDNFPSWLTEVLDGVVATDLRAELETEDLDRNFILLSHTAAAEQIK